MPLRLFSSPGVSTRSSPPPAATRLPLCLLLGVAACGGENLALPDQGQPTEITVVQGNRQNGTIGEPLADSLVVRVLDRFGDPVGGAEVTWTAEVGGSVSPATNVTSADGQAGTQRVLGGDVGTYVTTAAIPGMESAPEPAVFLTTGVAARLALIEPPPAAAEAGVPLSPQPVLQLQDAQGTPIAREGVVVTAQIGAGGGSLAGGTTSTSDATGRVAFADLTLRARPAPSSSSSAPTGSPRPRLQWRSGSARRPRSRRRRGTSRRRRWPAP